MQICVLVGRVPVQTRPGGALLCERGASSAFADGNVATGPRIARAMERAAFGIGAYTVPEAARIVGMTPLRLRRWLLGYDHDGKREAALWNPQYDPEDEDGMILGFRDLVEARIVNALRKKGIGLPTIRTCMDRARTIIGQDRPFSTSQFKTDGKTIFLEITRDLAEPQLVDLKMRQGVFSRVVTPSLADLDFGPGGAERWWLLHGKRSIVADPERSFGQPIVAAHGVTTARLAQAVHAEGSVARAAQLFEIKPRLVRDALAYENTLGMRRAA